MSTTPNSQPYDVIVVGAGPTGLTLARLLALDGVRVAVVDPNRIACQHPRATHLDDETMRVLQTLGFADMEPRFLRMEGWTLLDPAGEPFLSFAGQEGETDQGWQGSYQFHQPDMESRLRGLLAADATTDLWLGWHATSAEQAPEHATVEVRDRVTGDTRTLRAAYVVGADGAGSTLRGRVAVGVEDLHATQRSLIVDIHPFEHPSALPSSRGFIFCNGRTPITYLPVFPPKLRFEWMLLDGDDSHDAERPDRVYERLSPWLAPGSYRIQRTDVYEWHARLVSGWRNGRLLVAGDAAHTMPPMLGQGMCSGLRDAANLAWKLARVVQGRSAPDLLDTYESERSPQVRPYIEESARQANLIEAFGSAENRPHIPEPQVLDRFRPPLGPGLVRAPEGAVGVLGPQPRTIDGTLLDDVVGYRFAVVATPEVVAGVSDEVRAWWRQLGAVVVTQLDERGLAWLDSHDADAVILRPDRYVYGTTRGVAALEATTASLRDRLESVGVHA
jgi:3-(3-hydroxy-phenyl)propionate hydroxylase